MFVALLVMAGGLFLEPVAEAQVSVWVDFTTDAHDGGGGGPNSIPDWVDELDKLAAATGVTPFTPMERTAIETGIMTDLATIYAGYDIAFSTVTPTSPFDTLSFGKDNTGFGSLGIAPRDPGNIASGQVAEIAPANFDSTLDEFTGVTMRFAQIAQISTALAGSGSHELGHSLGLAHHNAYSHPSIHPGTYAATGGVQNTYIMATGPTGISELERETLRSIDPWSKAMFDITGGAVGKIAGDHQSLVTTPVLLDTTEEDPGIDAGPTLLTAKTMALTPGDTSGMLLGFVAGNPDGPTPPVFTTDVDVWKISVPSAGRLSAEIFSTERFGPFGYNTMLELLDSVGGLLFANDNVHFFGDEFGDPSDPLEQLDPFLLNIPLVSAGDYYLKVTPTMPFGPDVGMFDGYWLLAGFQPIPEPGTAGVLLAVGAIALLRRRRMSE